MTPEELMKIGRSPGATVRTLATANERRRRAIGAEATQATLQKMLQPAPERPAAPASPSILGALGLPEPPKPAPTYSERQSRVQRQALTASRQAAAKRAAAETARYEATVRREARRDPVTVGQFESIRKDEARADGDAVGLRQLPFQPAAYRLAVLSGATTLEDRQGRKIRRGEATKLLAQSMGIPGSQAWRLTDASSEEFARLTRATGGGRTLAAESPEDVAAFKRRALQEETGDNDGGYGGLLGQAVQLGGRAVRNAPIPAALRAITGREPFSPAAIQAQFEGIESYSGRELYGAALQTLFNAGDNVRLQAGDTRSRNELSQGERLAVGAGNLVSNLAGGMAVGGVTTASASALPRLAALAARTIGVDVATTAPQLVTRAADFRAQGMDARLAMDSAISEAVQSFVAPLNPASYFDPNVGWGDKAVLAMQGALLALGGLHGLNKAKGAAARTRALDALGVDLDGLGPNAAGLGDLYTRVYGALAKRDPDAAAEVATGFRKMLQAKTPEQWDAARMEFQGVVARQVDAASPEGQAMAQQDSFARYDADTRTIAMRKGAETGEISEELRHDLENLAGLSVRRVAEGSEPSPADFEWQGETFNISDFADNLYGGDLDAAKAGLARLMDVGRAIGESEGQGDYWGRPDEAIQAIIGRYLRGEFRPNLMSRIRKALGNRSDIDRLGEVLQRAGTDQGALAQVSSELGMAVRGARDAQYPVPLKNPAAPPVVDSAPPAAPAAEVATLAPPALPARASGLPTAQGIASRGGIEKAPYRPTIAGALGLDPGPAPEIVTPGAKPAPDAGVLSTFDGVEMTPAQRADLQKFVDEYGPEEGVRRYYRASSIGREGILDAPRPQIADVIRPGRAGLVGKGGRPRKTPSGVRERTLLDQGSRRVPGARAGGLERDLELTGTRPLTERPRSQSDRGLSRMAASRAPREIPEDLRGEASLGALERIRDDVKRLEDRGLTAPGKPYRSWDDAAKAGAEMADAEDILARLRENDRKGAGINDAEMAATAMERERLLVASAALDREIAELEGLGDGDGVRALEEMQRQVDARLGDLIGTAMNLKSQNGRSLAAHRMYVSAASISEKAVLARLRRIARRPLSREERARAGQAYADIEKAQKVVDARRRRAAEDAEARIGQRRIDWSAPTAEDLRDLALVAQRFLVGDKLASGAFGKWLEGQGITLPESARDVLRAAIARESGALARPSADAKAKLAKMMASMEETTTAEFLGAAVRAGLLASLRPFQASFGGNAAQALFEDVARLPAAMLDAIVSRATGERTRLATGFKEKRRAVYSKETLAAMRDALKGQAPEDYQGNVDATRRTRWKPDTRLGRTLSAYVNGVFDILSAADAPRRRGAYAQALREEIALEGNRQGLSGAELERFVAETMDAPPAGSVVAAIAKAADDEMPELMKMAEAALRRQRVEASAKREEAAAVFTNDSPVADLLGRLSRKAPVLSAFLLPFSRVPTNAIARGLEWTPIGAGYGAVRLGQAVRQRKNASRASVRELQRKGVDSAARSLTGMGLIYLGYQLAMMNVLEPPTEGDKAMRDLDEAAGAQGSSVKIGDRWLALRDVPALMPLFVGATLAEISRRDGDAIGEEIGIGDVATATFGGAARAIMDVPALQTAARAQRALQSGSQAALSGDAPVTESLVRNQFVAGFGSMIVPAFVTDLAAWNDPYRRAAQTPGEALMADLPVLRGRLPIAYDALGRARTRPSGLASQVRGLSAPVDGRDDATTRILRDAGVGVSLPSVKRSKPAQPGDDQSTADTEDRRREIGQARRLTLDAALAGGDFTAGLPADLRKKLLGNRVARGTRIGSRIIAAQRGGR